MNILVLLCLTMLQRSTGFPKGFTADLITPVRQTLLSVPGKGDEQTGVSASQDILGLFASAAYGSHLSRNFALEGLSA